MRKLTQENFIARSMITHKNYYNYSLVEYVINSNSIKIICPIHGVFLQTPNAHLMGKGCKKCNIKFSLEDFVLKANKVHNFKYDYSKVNYSDSTIKIIIICPVHGEFNQRPNQHLFGHGCPKCSYLISKPETAWLDILNIPKEYRQKSLEINLKKFRVDAYDPVVNIIYEFYGDYWHGNPAIYDPNDIHPEIKKTYGKLYQQTIQKEIILKNAGFDIISIWESDFKDQNRLYKC
jgi:hypothetical protein